MAWIWDVPHELMFWTLGSQMKVIVEGCGNVRRQGQSERSRSLEWIFWGVFSLAPSCLMSLKKCRIVLVPGPAQPLPWSCSAQVCLFQHTSLFWYSTIAHRAKRLRVKPQEEAPWTLAFSLWVRIDRIAKGIESSYILNREEAHTWAASMRLNYKTFKTLKIVALLIKYLEMLLKYVLMMYKYLEMFNLLYS